MADAGCIVDNVETLVAINRAVKEGKPVMDRIFTVTGDAVANPGNFEYCIGMSYAEILEEAGGFKEDPEKMISGGPMMGFQSLVWRFRQQRRHPPCCALKR